MTFSSSSASHGALLGEESARLFHFNSSISDAKALVSLFFVNSLYRPFTTHGTIPGVTGFSLL